ncbi:histidine kinase [Sphingomonas sp. Leaf357]|uniref:response regulator n=1 Tax=Sphingomonas sp. Leaf357 TaxID=1736350 RepID=UPI0006F5A18F|nr:response regulator [Sphingomonas sp. Leaf357]KQS03994.1 histidine kinase [Sphingomonas sp. Leaf357]
MCHVLIIEDEALIALDLQDVLTGVGATSFDFAETRSEAVTAARLRRPDVITSDVMLREGTGPDAVADIIGELGPLPVIFITATPGACIPCPATSPILAKPVRNSALCEAFRAVAPH